MQTWVCKIKLFLKLRVKCFLHLAGYVLHFKLRLLVEAVDCISEWITLKCLKIAFIMFSTRSSLLRLWSRLKMNTTCNCSWNSYNVASCYKTIILPMLLFRRSCFMECRSIFLILIHETRLGMNKKCSLFCRDCWLGIIRRCLSWSFNLVSLGFWKLSTPDPMCHMDVLWSGKPTSLPKEWVEVMKL